MKLFWRNTRIHPPLIKGEEAGKHMECLDIMDIKQNNIKSIMNVLRENNGQSGMTKKEIADKTGLSFATVSNLCNELLERCIVESVSGMQLQWEGHRFQSVSRITGSAPYA